MGFNSETASGANRSDVELFWGGFDQFELG